MVAISGAQDARPGRFNTKVALKNAMLIRLCYFLSIFIYQQRLHAGVIESAVVGYPHDIKGQGIYAFVIYGHMHVDEEQTRKDIFQTITRQIGAIARPDKIQFVSGLPKTRSGKIMRRILRKIAEGETENLGDISTLLDPAVVDEIKKGKL